MRQSILMMMMMMMMMAAEQRAAFLLSPAFPSYTGFNSSNQRRFPLHHVTRTTDYD